MKYVYLFKYFYDVSMFQWFTFHVTIGWSQDTSVALVQCNFGLRPQMEAEMNVSLHQTENQQEKNMNGLKNRQQADKDKNKGWSEKIQPLWRNAE